MSDTYDIGYKHPPKHKQFKRGRSGNPGGRPKGSKNFKTELNDELQETIIVREGGCAERISKQRAVIKTLVNGTLKGDKRSASNLLNTIYRMLDSDERDVSSSAEPLTDDEREVIELLEARLCAIRGAVPVSRDDCHPAPEEKRGADEPEDQNLR